MTPHGGVLHAVALQADLLVFLVLGLVGSVSHCVGMCSPFVLIVARRFGGPGAGRSPLTAQLWYAGGRVLTYAVLGAAAGSLGGVVEMAGTLVGVQRAAAVAAGLALIGFAGVSLTGRAFSSGTHGRWFARVSGTFAGRMPGHPLTVGLLLGLLPCGLLYAAVAGAVARGGALGGGLALAGFGVGTIPALLGVSLADHRLVRHRATVNRYAQMFVLAMGMWYVWTGMGGVPGLPPP